jgi:hypothetical protein
MDNLKLYNLFLEQSPNDLRAVSTPPSGVVQLDDPNYKGPRRGVFIADKHTGMEILGMGSLFLGPIGLLVGAGIGLIDAAMYAEEGEGYDAGLTAVFSLLPVIGPIINKIPGIKTLGKNGMSSLIKKIKGGDKLTKIEKEVIDGIEKNKNFITQEYNKFLTNVINKNKDKILNSKLNDKVKQTVINTAKVGGDLTKIGLKIVGGTLKGGKNLVVGGTKVIAPAVGTILAYDKLYGIIQSDSPKIVVEKMGLDWEETKSEFGSSGSVEDNLKLKNALLSGWKPGQEVPEKFQTKKYTTKKEIESDSLNGINEKEYNLINLSTEDTETLESLISKYK